MAGPSAQRAGLDRSRPTGTRPPAATEFRQRTPAGVAGERPAAHPHPVSLSPDRCRTTAHRIPATAKLPAPTGHVAAGRTGPQPADGTPPESRHGTLGAARTWPQPADAGGTF